MRLLSKYLIIVVSIFYVNCTNSDEWEKQRFTSEAQVYIDRILKENNTTEYNVDVSYNSSLGAYGYHLGLIIDKQIVITSTIDSLRLHGTYRYDKNTYLNGGELVDASFWGISAECDTLDSIQIITDSVIVLRDLILGDCNLTHVPPEIGKMRVNSLNISCNQIKDLPLEIMSIFNHLTNDSGTININDSPITQEYWDSIPDTLRNWLLEH